jgi:RNA polymerase sigma factor (sigma-70 family)
MLARQVGVQHLELVEDAVQCALMAALTAWTQQCVPEDPGGWLYKVAHNKLIQDLRRASGRLKILEEAAGDLSEGAAHPVDPLFSEEIRDDMLRMLFVCCHEDVPWESRLVLALKTLCGFSTAEIALRLFTSEANVHKRLARARDRLRETMPDVESPPLDKLESRLCSVHSVLYLLFNEGYLSAHAEQTIRRELCEEAIRLTMLLAQHTVGATPQTFALLALMHLHMARLGSRVDATGGLLLLEEQDRSAWEVDRIYTGLEWLRRSATGDVFSRYHAEAGIAAEHCLAPSYRQTRWQEIDDLYARLERSAPSPLHTLNRAVAIAEWRGPQAALALLDGVEVPTGLCGSYLWEAVLADLHRRAGHPELSQHHRQRALGSAPTHAVRELLRRRLAAPD